MQTVNQRQVWTWHELPLSEFSHATFESISTRFRGPNPVCLLTRFESCKGVVVVNALSPMNWVFWGSPRHATLWQHDWRVDLLHTLSLSVVKQLKQEFNLSRVAINTYAGGWFQGLWSWLRPKNNKYESLSMDGLNRESSRHWTIALPTASLPTFMALLVQETEQFSQYAFFPCDESESLRGPDLGLDEVCYEAEILAGRLLGISYTNLEAVQLLLRTLAETVAELEAGQAFDFNMSAREIAVGRPVFSSAILSALSGGELWEAERQVLSYRARLVRLLGWPSHFDAIQEVLLTADSTNGVLSYDITCPYDVAEELRCFTVEMASRYPVLAGK